MFGVHATLERTLNLSISFLTSSPDILPVVKLVPRLVCIVEWLHDMTSAYTVCGERKFPPSAAQVGIP